MKPSHVGIFGSTGSGKSSMARMLVEPMPRLLVLDHSADQIWSTVGSEFSDPQRAMNWYVDHAEEDFRATLRFRDPDLYLPFLGAAYDLHQEGDLRPLVIVMEEATEWSESWEIPEELEAVATRGRKHGIILVTITQESTQIHRTVRRQAFLSVLLWHRELPSDLSGILDPEQRGRTRELEPLTPYTEPVYGEHYITAPPQVNPYRHLLEATTSQVEELPEDYKPPRPG